MPSGTAGTVTITNNIIFGNSAPNLYGGGVYAESYASSGTAGMVSLTNNTITENSAQDGGGVLLSIGNTGGAISAYNNIVWVNTATASGDDIYLSKGSGGATSYNNNYSNIAGDGWDNESGKMAVDPLFAGSGDYHLQPTSPCIDTGTNSAPDILSTDFEGDPRIMDGKRDGDVIVDIGADERHRLWCVDGDTGASGDGTSWSEAFKTIGEALDAASDGDEIWVKQGTYPLTSQLTLDKAVHMYGGFAGTETVRNQRDWLNNTTTVNGQNATYRCFYVSADATIDGFTITAGNATGTDQIMAVEVSIYLPPVPSSPIVSSRKTMQTATAAQSPATTMPLLPSPTARSQAIPQAAVGVVSAILITLFPLLLTASF